MPESQRKKQRKKKTPSYRQRGGYDQAIVTLTDAITKERRDYWLGEFESPESWESFHRVIADWEAGGWRLSVVVGSPAMCGPASSRSDPPHQKTPTGLPGTVHPRFFCPKCA